MIKNKDKLLKTNLSFYSQPTLSKKHNHLEIRATIGAILYFTAIAIIANIIAFKMLSHFSNFLFKFIMLFKSYVMISHLRNFRIKIIWKMYFLPP